MNTDGLALSTFHVSGQDGIVAAFYKNRPLGVLEWMSVQGFTVFEDVELPLRQGNQHHRRRKRDGKKSSAEVGLCGQQGAVPGSGIEAACRKGCIKQGHRRQAYRRVPAGQPRAAVPARTGAAAQRRLHGLRASRYRDGPDAVLLVLDATYRRSDDHPGPVSSPASSASAATFSGGVLCRLHCHGRCRGCGIQQPLNACFEVRSGFMHP